MVGSVGSSSYDAYAMYGVGSTQQPAQGVQSGTGATSGAAKDGGKDTVEFSQELMKLLDKNGDGSISTDELSAAVQQMQGSNQQQAGATGGAAGAAPAAGPGGHGGHGHFIQALLKGADTDGDGSISATELNSALNKIDTNGDGKLSFPEMIAAKKAQMGGGADGGIGGIGGGAAGGVKGHHHGGGGGGGGGDSVTAATDPRDTNGDGVVSIDEMLAALGQDMTNATGSATDTSSTSAGSTDTDGSDANSSSSSTNSISIDSKQLAALLQPA